MSEETANIVLIPIGNFENDLMIHLADGIANEFNVPVRIREASFDLSDYFDPGRRQYNGNKLLEQLGRMITPGSLKTIGLFNVDLFIPILTFIFGQATLGGDKGIASAYRLNNELYGMPPDKNLLRDRFRKEVIHELGHTFGLIHCQNVDCVMRASTYVEDIDLKSMHLCDSCRNALRQEK